MDKMGNLSTHKNVRALHMKACNAKDSCHINQVLRFFYLLI